MKTWQVVAVVVCACVAVCACVLSACLAFQTARSNVMSKMSKSMQLAADSNRQTMNSPESVRKQVQQAPTATCPTHYGFHNCTDARFNEGKSPGVAAVLDKKLGYDPSVDDSLGAKHLCCKYGNALADMRPEVRKDVKDANLWANLGVFMAALVSAFIPMGLILTAGTELAFAGSMVAMEEVGGAPYIKCRNNWRGSTDDVVAHDFKNEDGRDVFQLFTTNDGCPITMGLPNEVEYAVEVGKALAEIEKTAKGYLSDTNKVEIIPFKDFVPSKQGTSRRPIKCYMNCERESRGGQFADCKCDDCARYDREGTGTCMKCTKVKGDGVWRCDQSGGNGFKDTL